MSRLDSSYKDTAVRLIKCFCGCSDMTIEEVQRIFTLTNSVHSTLLDAEATRLFHSYLQQQRSGDKNETEQYLDIYEKCSEFLQEEQHTFAQDEIEELCDLGLPYDMEQELTRRVLRAKPAEIKLYLNRIQGKCCNEIETSMDFKRFRDAILDKIKRASK